MAEGSSMENRPGDARRTVLMGCLGAMVMGMLSCCVLLGLAIAPALDTTVPPPPISDPVKPDITIIVQEAYLDRMLTSALPGPLADGASLDIRGDDRLVISASFDVLLTELDVIITLRMFAQGGELQIGMEGIETGGVDVLDLLQVDREALGQRMSDAIQGQVEAGLGQGAEVLGVRMEENQIVITARWVL